MRASLVLSLGRLRRRRLYRARGPRGEPGRRGGAVLTCRHFGISHPGCWRSRPPLRDRALAVRRHSPGARGASGSAATRPFAARAHCALGSRAATPGHEAQCLARRSRVADALLLLSKIAGVSREGPASQSRGPPASVSAGNQPPRRGFVDERTGLVFGEHAQQCRLAAAARPEQRVELALLDPEVNGLHGPQGAEALRDALEPEEASHAAGCAGRAWTYGRGA